MDVKVNGNQVTIDISGKVVEIDVSHWPKEKEDAFFALTGLLVARGNETFLYNPNYWKWDKKLTCVSAAEKIPQPIGLTDLTGIFEGNQQLTTLNLTDWDFSKVSSIKEICKDCTNLKMIKCNGAKFNSLKDCSYAFDNCRSLEIVEDAGWDLSTVEDANRMFRNCVCLKKIDCSEWKMKSVKDITSIFYGCEYLHEIGIESWEVVNLETADLAFAKCKSLEGIDFSKWCTTKIRKANGLLKGCESLTSADFSNWKNTEISMYSLMDQCNNLKVLNLRSWETISLEEAESIFGGSIAITNHYNGDRLKTIFGRMVLFGDDKQIANMVSTVFGAPTEVKKEKVTMTQEEAVQVIASN